MARKNLILIALLCLLILGAQASDKSYYAKRFDVNLRVKEDGSIMVRETVVFHFTGGPFTYVYRDLNLAGTDGIIGIYAWLDGVSLPKGTGPGQVEIVPKSGTIHVTWHMANTSDSEHTFILVYQVMGSIRHEKNTPVLRWWAIPSEHGYVIEHSTISLETPGSVEIKNIGLDISFQADEGNPGIMTVSEKINENQGVILTAQFIPATINTPMPVWQAETQEKTRGFWATISLAAAILGILLLLFSNYLKRKLTNTKQLLSSNWMLQRTPPGDLSPALAGKLVFNRDEPLATLFDLARRGFVQIQKLPKDRRTKKKFSYSLREGTSLDYHEKRLLTMISCGFGSGDPDIETYSWVLEYKTLLRKALDQYNLLNKSDLKDKSASEGCSSELFILAGYMCGIALLWLAWEFWSFRDIRAILIGFGWLSIAIPTITSLRSHITGRCLPYTDYGYKTALEWRGFAEYLKKLARGKEGIPSPDLFDRYLGYATAFGMLNPWIKAFRSHTDLPQPGYFQISINDGDYKSFDPFIFNNLANATQAYRAGDSDGGGWGGGGGGDASGGGGSGAG